MPEEKNKIIVEINQEEQEEKQAKKTIRVLAFSLSKETYCIDIKQAKEVVRISQITKVPNTPEFIVGVVNLRGEVITLLDIKYFLGLKETEKAKEARALITDAAGSSVGIIVDNIREAMDVGEDLIQPPLATLNERLARYTKGQLQWQGEILIFIDMERIIKSEEVERLKKGE